MPIFPASLNVMGKVNWWLSTDRLKKCRAEADEDGPQALTRRDAFSATFRKDTLTTVLAGRRLATPVTYTMVFCFGDQRTSDAMEEPWRAGCVPAISIPVMLVAGAPLAVVGAATCTSRGAQVGCLLPAFACQQLSAAVGVVPTAAITGLLALVSAPVAAAHGAVAAARFRPAEDAHRPGEPCINSQTVLSLEPPTGVPAAMFFRSESNHGFDIRELVECLRHSGDWINPHGGRLTPQDIINLARHPSGEARGLVRWMQRGHQAEEISAATREALRDLSQALAADGETLGRDVANDNTRVALVAATEHVTHLSPVERAACDRHLALQTGDDFSTYFRGLVSGHGCTKAFSRHVLAALERLEKFPPRR